MRRRDGQAAAQRAERRERAARPRARPARHARGPPSVSTPRAVDDAPHARALGIRTPRSSSRARSPSARRAGWTVRRRASTPRRGRRGRRSARRPPRRQSGRRGRRPRARAATRTASAPARPARARSRRRAARRGANHASTPCSSHQAPMNRTDASDARPTASAPASPNRARNDGSDSHMSSAKPPLRPLGPWPHRSASTIARRALGGEVPRGPQAGVAAADDDDVRASSRRAGEGRGRRPRPPRPATSSAPCAARRGGCHLRRQRVFNVRRSVTFVPSHDRHAGGHLQRPARLAAEVRASRGTACGGRPRPSGR